MKIVTDDRSRLIIMIFHAIIIRKIVDDRNKLEV